MNWQRIRNIVSLGQKCCRGQPGPGKGANGKVPALDIIEWTFICLVSKSSSPAKPPLWQEVFWRSYRGRSSWWRSWQQWATKTSGISPLWWKVSAPPAGRPWNQSTPTCSCSLESREAAFSVKPEAHSLFCLKQTKHAHRDDTQIHVEHLTFPVAKTALRTGDLGCSN